MSAGHITVKIEAFAPDGTRFNIECFSISYQSFLARSHEYMTNLHQAEQRAMKEILNPTPKTDMA